MKKLALIISLFFFQINMVNAQVSWVDHFTPSSMFPGSTVISDLEVQKDTTLWAATISPGLLYKSVDHGLSWQYHTTFGFSEIHFIHFMTDQSGIAVTYNPLHGYPYVHYTTDKGATWGQANLGATASGLRMKGYHFVDSLTGYLFGDYGYLSKTTDGGANWTKITTPTTGTINSLHLRQDTLILDGWYKGVVGNIRRVFPNIVFPRRSHVRYDSNIQYAYNMHTNHIDRSNDNGRSWQPEMLLPNWPGTYEFKVIDTNKFVLYLTSGSTQSVPGKIRTSFNRGLNWNTEITLSTLSSDVHDVAVLGDLMWAATNHDIYRRSFLTGLDESSNDVSLDFYPNPVQDQLNFESDWSRIDIIDIKGQIIKTFENPRRTIDLNDLDNGIYVVRAHDNNETFFCKIVKK